MAPRIPVRRDGVLSRQIGDESVLYDSEKDSVHIINAMAEFVWNMCDGSNSLDEIERHLNDTHTIPEEATVREDLESIIQSFVDLGVLSINAA